MEDMDNDNYAKYCDCHRGPLGLWDIWRPRPAALLGYLFFEIYIT